MDEKGDDGIGMDDEPEVSNDEKDVADNQPDTSLVEKDVNAGQSQESRPHLDMPAEKVSLKAKLEAMKAKVAGQSIEKTEPQRAKSKEETL